MTFVDHDFHKANRQAIAPYFSKAKINARQDIIHHNLEKLTRRIAPLDGKTFNLGAAISAFTRDVASTFVIGKSTNQLELEDFGVDISSHSQGAGQFWRITKHIRWFGPTFQRLPPGLMMMMVRDEKMRSFFQYLKVLCPSFFPQHSMHFNTRLTKPEISKRKAIPAKS